MRSDGYRFFAALLRDWDSLRRVCGLRDRSRMNKPVRRYRENCLLPFECRNALVQLPFANIYLPTANVSAAPEYGPISEGHLSKVSDSILRVSFRFYD